MSTTELKLIIKQFSVIFCFVRLVVVSYRPLAFVIAILGVLLMETKSFKIETRANNNDKSQ